MKQFSKGKNETVEEWG